MSQKPKPKKVSRSEFIDDEAELSGEDEVSEDEFEDSDVDDADLEELVDREAPDLDADEEEAIRGFYHKQIESEDKRAVLLLQEQLEDKDVAVGQRRRRKFRWQTRELMDISLRRHYDPDDDDSQEGLEDEDEDFDDLGEIQPRLRRPTAEALLLGSSRITTQTMSELEPGPSSAAGPSSAYGDDSNSNTITSRITNATTRTSATSDLNRFLFRDKEIVQALSTKETVIVSREEKDRNIQRELKRVLESKSIFDQLYS